MKTSLKQVVIPACMFIILLISIFASPYMIRIPFYLLPSAPDNAYIHFSVDDTIDLFADLTRNEDVYDTIFDQPDLAFFKQLHDRYGVVVTFYCFYSWDVDSGGFTLADATDSFSDEFSANADWLHFGFHAKDAPAYEFLNADLEEEWYDRTITELIRITGSDACIDHTLRLDRYTADSETVQMLYSKGIQVLLCPDPASNATSCYDLAYDEFQHLYEQDWFTKDNFMAYTPTDLRFEAISCNLDLLSSIAQVRDQTNFVVFTHAWFLQDPLIRRYITEVAEYGKTAGYNFSFITAVN